MRLPEEKVKQAIVHPEREVREMAIQYFSGSFSAEQTIMPLVIEAIDTYGWQNAISFYCVREGLAQTHETLGWILGELAQESNPRDEDTWRYRSGLVDLLNNTDPHLLAEHQSEIMNLDGLGLEFCEGITERIRLLSADLDTCWAELGEFCERERHKKYINEVDFGEAYRLVEAIARGGERYVGRVLGILEEEIKDFRNHPMAWLEPLVIRLAGEMRLVAAIPMIVRKLHEEGDLLHQECERALARIGTDKVVEAVSADFAGAEWSFRLYASGVFERIHSDFAVSKGLEFLQREKDTEIKVWLGQALVRQLAFDVVEPIRQVIVEGPIYGEMVQLRNDLVTAATLMEVEFPELEKWKEESEKETERTGSLFAPPAKNWNADSGDYSDAEIDDEPIPPPRIVSRQGKVGRNEPCPCGSGKKYKKCCLRKQSFP